MASAPSPFIRNIFSERRFCDPGLVLLSSYSAQFWERRLEWFKLRERFETQAAHHLIGEIDYDARRNGVIVCKYFRATTADDTTFAKLAAVMGVSPRMTEVDGSSLFCEIVVP